MATVSDDFTRADATSLGANWNTYGGQKYQIVGNQATLYAAGGGYNGVSWTANSFTGNQFAQCTIVQLPTNDYAPGPCIRSDTDGVGNGYAASVRSDGLIRLMRNTSTVKNSAAGAFSAGSVLRIEDQGSGAIRVYVDGALVTSGGFSTQYTDGSPLTGGRIGMFGYAFFDGASNWIVDNWSGGDLAGGASAPLAQAQYFARLRSG